jgi:hypothetical protein
MDKEIYRSVSRGRRLMRSEAAEYRRVREEVQQELPPIKPEGVKVVIAKLRAIREAQGVTVAEEAARAGMTRSQRGMMIDCAGRATCGAGGALMNESGTGGEQVSQ